MDEIIALPYNGQKTLNNFEEQPREYSPEPAKAIYPRDWSNYTLARQKEKLMSLDLLNEAIKILNVKNYGKGNGRPPFQLADKLFLCIQKVLRQATYDSNEEYIEYSRLKGYIHSQPRPHSVCDFMNDPQLIPLFEQLITLTATPVAEFEKRFGVDSTGLSSFNKSRWIQVRLEHKQHRDYKKIHTIVGTRTNIIVAAKVTIGTQGDSPMLIPLMDIASKYFNIKELSADGGYCSRKNSQAVEDIGAIPYFKLRKDLRSLSHGCPAWKKMIYRFKENKTLYEKHYHFRSNVETTYHMFKRKVSSFLKSKTSTAKTNEALCIAIAHNLFCLVNAVFCDNLNPDFRR